MDPARHAAATPLRDAAGAVADLGVLLPLVAALALASGVNAGIALLVFAAANLAAGHWFRVPMPVQPIKAAGAIAVAQHLPASQLRLAGAMLAGILALLALTGAIGWVASWFTPPIVRGLQLGVGLLLLRAAVHLAGTQAWLALAIALGLVVATWGGSRQPWALLTFVAGVAVSIVGAGHLTTAAGAAAAMAAPVADTNGGLLWATLVVLVIPQLPLTLGNAVVATTALEHEYFPDGADRVDERSVALSFAGTNLGSFLLGGIPMCHGAGGLTAHYAAGARTSRMNTFTAVVLAALGIAALAGADLVSIVPAVVLAGFLAFTAVMHAALVDDQRGPALALAVAIGAIGYLTGNLAWGLALGLVAAPLLRRGTVAQPT